jgi:sulfur carrier protein ThiS adenylyltransferase
MTELQLYARNFPESQAQSQNKLRCAKVAVAGLGGLGSNIAVMLARIGVGELVLADFDRVEISNLNRQHYNRTHIGRFKTDALEEQLRLINPFVSVKTHTVKVTADNAVQLFGDCCVVCEAFDCAQFKADLVSAMLAQGRTVVAASGMNGAGDSNLITTQRKLANLYVCGDALPPPEEGIGFLAPRVMLCAAHQANMVTRLLLGEIT